MDWAWHGARWPNARHSRFVACRPHRWHLQQAGPADAPRLLMLHGAGGATHSWRDLFPDLARDLNVLAVDLPGQGFSRAGSRARLGLDGMAVDLARLLSQENFVPDVILGHSAGAALALRLVRELPRHPRGIVALNGALGKFRGVAGWLFPVLAKLLSLNPLTAAMFARTGGTPATVRSLIRSTGSQLDAEGLALYGLLLGDRAHVDGTLAMMARWELDPLIAALPMIDVPVLLLTGMRDTAVPPETSARAAALLPRAHHENLPDLGHLMHEDAAALIAARLRAWLQDLGLRPPETRPPAPRPPGAPSPAPPQAPRRRPPPSPTDPAAD